MIGVAAAVAACASIVGIQDRGAFDDDAGGEAGMMPGLPESGSPGPDASSSGPDAESGPDGGSGDAQGTAIPDSGASEGVVCLEGGADADPCLLVVGLDNPLHMAADATRVYWVEVGDALGAGNGSVKSCAIKGCNGQPQVIASNLMNPKAIALDGVNVYWSTSDTRTDAGLQPTGGIWSCPLGGCTGSPTRLASSVNPYSLAASGTYVYWTDPQTNGVYRLATDTAPPVPTLTIYDGGGSYVPADVAEPAVDSKNVYIEDFDSNLYRVPITGGNPTMVAAASTNSGVPYGITNDTPNVYYGQGTQIFSLDKASLDVTPLQDGIQQPVSLALNTLTTPSTIYWADFGSGTKPHDGAIGKVFIDGTGGGTIVNGAATPEAITVGGGYALWISAGTLVSSSADSAMVVPSSGTLWRTAR